MAKHNELGRKGEEAAVNCLKRKGHRVLERNWSFSGYEIDIISEYEEFIVFVEVKTRSSVEWGNPENAVTEQRMRRMIRAASHYLKKYKITNRSRWFRETVLNHVLKNMEQDYPTLFEENEMRR